MVSYLAAHGSLVASATRAAYVSGSSIVVLKTVGVVGRRRDCCCVSIIIVVVAVDRSVVAVDRSVDSYTVVRDSQLAVMRPIGGLGGSPVEGTTYKLVYVDSNRFCVLLLLCVLFAHKQHLVWW